MPSKGVDYYFLVSNVPTSIQASAYDNGADSPKFSQTFSQSPSFQTGNVQIDFEAALSLYGKFTWSSATQPSVSGEAKINPLTGNMGGGNLAEMMNTPSVIGPNFSLSYGFYDAGPGFKPLTNQDQAYAYITPVMTDWMGQLGALYPEVLNQPFCRFALPGAHDTGTFDLSTVQSLLNTPAAAGILLALLGQFAFGAIVKLASSQAMTAITNLAVTQKDNISTLLNLGCRYFDFRPGYAPSQIRSFAPDIYHQHTVIPGYPFKSFLNDVLTWLADHPNEIVVVGANHQGFLNDDMIPTGDTLSAMVDKAITQAKSNIVPGSAADLNTNYGALLKANKRLIFLNGFSDWYPSTKYDSYSDSAYATTDPSTIIAALNGMTGEGQQGNDYTVLQFQGTATNTGKEVIVSAALSQSSASSPLISTKPLFDSNTYPWALTHINDNLSIDNLVVMLNDFVDGELAQTALIVSMQRMGLNQESQIVSIESVQFPGVFLRMDGTNVTQPNGAGSGVVNCQFTPPGPWEKFRMIKLEDGTYNLESAQFPGVFLRMDGTRVTQPNGAGAGTVNCQFQPPGPWEKFRLIDLENGTFQFESVQFPGVFLRMDGREVTSPNGSGSGVVNCQFTPPGPWEVFRLHAESGN